MNCCCLVNTIRKASSVKIFKNCSLSQVPDGVMFKPYSLPAHLSIFASAPLEGCQHTSREHCQCPSRFLPADLSIPPASLSICLPANLSIRLLYRIHTDTEPCQPRLLPANPSLSQFLTPKFSYFPLSERCAGKNTECWVWKTPQKCCKQVI